MECLLHGAYEPGLLVKNPTVPVDSYKDRGEGNVGASPRDPPEPGGVETNLPTPTPGVGVGTWYNDRVRDDELRHLLRDRNPWWRLTTMGHDPVAWAATDPALAGAAAVGIDYDPDVLADVAPPGLWVLRGPRRVGHP